MAMIQCPECNQPLSDQAYTCPHCGYPIKKDKYQLNRYTTPSCPGATFMRVMGILDIIGGVICAILFSFQERVVGYYYTYTETYFDWGTFFTVLACCVVSSIFFFILANVIKHVHDTYEIVSTLNISKDCINAQPDYALSKKLQTKNTSTAAQSWTCEKCGASTPEEIYFCKICGSLRPLPTQKSKSAAPTPAVPENSPEGPTEQRWTCENCNSTNSAHSPVCDICGTPKPGASSAQPPSNASVPRRRTQVQGWHCPECGTENSLDTEKCTRCGYAE